jgi:hypothetical protein
VLVRDVDWKSKVLVRASYDLFLQCATKVIFSRDNPLSNASNLLLTDPIQSLAKLASPPQAAGYFFFLLSSKGLKISLAKTG